MSPKLAGLLGWYGAVVLLFGYLLISFGILPADGLAYQLMAVTSTIGLTVISLAKRVWQTAILNAVATVIGLVAITNILIHRAG